MRKKRRSKPTEITGVFLFSLAIFLFISLVSFNSQDPSWVGASSSNSLIQNYAGRVGAMFSKSLLFLFGMAAFILPLGLSYISVLSFRPSKKERFLIKIINIFLLIITTSALIHIFYRYKTWQGSDILISGITGKWASGTLIQFFNRAGAIIILLSLGTILFMLLTHLSISKILRSLYKLAKWTFKELHLQIAFDWEREPRRKAKSSKYSKSAVETTEETHKKRESNNRLKVYDYKERINSQIMTDASLSTPVHTQAPSHNSMSTKLNNYRFPSVDLLTTSTSTERIDDDELYEKKRIIETKLQEFNVEGEVRECHPGPVITSYEFFPSSGIKVSQVVGLSEEVALALKAKSVRIRRLPGRSSLGVEAPNNHRETIRIRDVIESEQFQRSPSNLTFALGKDVEGNVYVTDLSKMPHLLIAGATGTGKSVTLNALITSILYKATPDEVKLMLIDPKRLEFSVYDEIPHLLTPIVRDPKKAEGVLLSAIEKMEDRYRKLQNFAVRDITQFNELVTASHRKGKIALTDTNREDLKPLPQIVIIIDELAELMMEGPREIEYCIERLANKARAVGIHLVLATQRPSTDVLTGTIKNNFSSRISFRVPSQIDSRIVIDAHGAEKLLGEGDMLFIPPENPRPRRLHGSFVSLDEINRLVDFVKSQGKPKYDEKIAKVLKSPTGYIDEMPIERDPFYEKALELILYTGQASASYLQRKLKLGYARAARIIDQMEYDGVVGPGEGSKPREILISPEAYYNQHNGERTNL